MRKESDLNVILEIIANEKFVIYGAGSVGKRFAQLLINKGCYKNALSFVETNKESNNDLILDRPLKNILDIDRKTIVLVAVHDVHWIGIDDYLKRNGYMHYYWIYPYMFDLHYGNPIQKNVSVEIKHIVRSLQGSYAHVIYYLAIKNYFSGAEVGKSIYIKYMSIFSELRTANQRYALFEKKIQSCQKDTFVQNGNIKLTMNKDIILDGAHRLMLALWFGMDNVFVDIYDAGIKEYIDFSKNIAITEDELEMYFTSEEIKIIKETEQELKAV